MTAPRTLDPFQQALLDELRSVVDGGEVTTPRPRPRWPLAAAAVVALVGAGLALPALSGEQAAYAVVQGANGRVDVRVVRLDDAAGLERALARAGVRADVTYLPPDTQCAPGRYTEAVAPVPDADLAYTVGESVGYRLQLGPGAVGDDQTVVIEGGAVTASTSEREADGVSDLGGSWGSFGIADGRVGPCVPVPRD